MRILFVFAAIASLLASCQTNTHKTASGNSATPDTTRTQSIQPGKSGYADVNGLKLYYEVYGNGDPIVLLHGSHMTIPLNWTEWIPRLAKNRQVIVLEMQGHGRTADISRPITLEAMADDVSGLLKNLSVDSADVLGYSFGGGVAFQFAIRHPDQLRKLVIMSGVYAHDGWYPEAEESFKHFDARMFEGTPIKKHYDSLNPDPAHFAEFVKKVIQVDLKPYDWSVEANKIRQPVMQLLGDADGVRYEHALELYRALGGGKQADLLKEMPQSRLAIIPGTTHIGMMKRPDWLIPMINDFLDAKPTTPPPGF